MIRYIDENGELVLKKGLFTFTYQNKTYLVTKDSAPRSDSVFCERISWNIWSGTHICTSSVDEEVYELADKLLALFQDKPEKYPMNEEHYNIIEHTTDRGVRRKIEKCETLSMFRRRATVSALIVRLILTLAAGVLAVKLYLMTDGLEWAFTVFSDFDRESLTAVLYAIELIGSMLLFWPKRYNTYFVYCLLNVFLPINTITLIGCMTVNSPVRWTVIGIFGFCLIFLVYPLLKQSLKRKTKAGRRRLLWKSAMSRMEMTLFCCVVIASFAINYYGITGYVSQEPSVSTFEDVDEIEENFEQALGKIRKSVWRKLTNGEKLEVLQAICDYECIVVLGCPSVPVKAGTFNDENQKGEFNPEHDHIVIEISYINNGPVDKVLGTLIHEVRHSWQHVLVEVYDSVKDDIDEKYLNLTFFKNALEFKESLEGYVSGNDDFDSYYVQSVEVDSRTWSDYRIDEYYKDYINGVKKVSPKN